MESQNVDMWKHTVQKDINDMKGEIRQLQDKSLLQNLSIQNIESDLKEIKEDTKWLKQTITNAILTAIITGILGGGIAIVFQVLQN